MVSEDMLSLGVIVGYMIITLGIGIWVYYQREEDTTENYFLYGRKVGWILLPLTMVASLQSTFAMLGAAGIFHANGIGFVVIAISQAWVAFMVLYFGWRLWALGKRHDYITLHQFLEHRFNSRILKYVTAFISFWMVFVFMALQFVGAGHAISGVAGEVISYEGAVVLAVLMTGIYVALGGMRGVVYTDALQVIVLIVSVIAIGVIVTGYVGPIDSLPSLFNEVRNIEPSLLSLPGAAGSYDTFGWISSFIVLPFGIFMMPHIWVRLLAAKDERSLTSSAISIPISQLVIFVTSVMFAGLAGWVIYGQMAQPDTVVPSLLDDFMPWWVASFIIAGVMAAGRSTIDSMMLVSDQILVSDFVRDFFETTEKQRTWISRGLIIVLMILSIIIALSPPELFVQVIIDIAYAGVAMVTPAFIAGLYWKRANKWGAISGTTIGFILVFTSKMFGYSLPVQNDIFSFVLNVVLLVVVSLITGKPNKKAVQETVGYLDKLQKEAAKADEGEVLEITE